MQYTIWARYYKCSASFKYVLQHVLLHMGYSYCSYSKAISTTLAHRRLPPPSLPPLAGHWPRLSLPQTRLDVRQGNLTLRVMLASLNWPNTCAVRTGKLQRSGRCSTTRSWGTFWVYSHSLVCYNIGATRDAPGVYSEHVPIARLLLVSATRDVYLPVY